MGKKEESIIILYPDKVNFVVRDYFFTYDLHFKLYDFNKEYLTLQDFSSLRSYSLLR